VTSAATLESDMKLSRTALLAAGAQQTTSGGATKSDQDGFPLEAIERASGELSLRETRRDSLVSLLALAHTSFTTGARYLSIETGESWVHRFSSRNETTFGAGLVPVVALGRNDSGKTNFFPTAQLLVKQRFLAIAHRDVGLTVDAGAGPYFDRLTGAVYERFKADATATWALSDKVLGTLAVLSTFAPKSVEASEIAMWGVQAGVEQPINPHFAWRIGALAVGQQQAGIAGATFQWVVFIAFVMKERI
jgi:hypothetical protein